MPSFSVPSGLCAEFLMCRVCYVLVIPWFVRMYDAMMHERERVHYRMYMRRTMV